MKLIDEILKEEKERNYYMQMHYINEISKLPIGNLIIKKIGNKEYCYLHYKKDGKTCNKYCGSIADYDRTKKLIIRRKHCEEMLDLLKKEYIRIEKMEKIK